MLRRGRAIAVTIGVLAFCAMLCVQYGRMVSAQRSHRAALASLADIERMAGRVVELRGEQERVSWSQHPETDLLAVVNAALIDAGVTTDRLQGIREGADTPVPGASGGGIDLRRQTLSIVLEGLSPSATGRFLKTWRETASNWEIDRLELTQHRGSGEPGLYDLRVHVSIVYVAP